MLTQVFPYCCICFIPGKRCVVTLTCYIYVMLHIVCNGVYEVVRIQTSLDFVKQDFSPSFFRQSPVHPLPFFLGGGNQWTAQKTKWGPVVGGRIGGACHFSPMNRNSILLKQLPDFLLAQLRVFAGNRRSGLYCLARQMGWFMALCYSLGGGGA